MNSDPIDQFGDWFSKAKQDENYDGTAMSLATVDEFGHADCRIVLLKGFDKKGFQFFTNYESEKSRQLLVNPYATLVFYWPTQYRQVRIRGSVDVLGRQESEDYFDSRLRESQLSAWASPQSATVQAREDLEWRKLQFSDRFKDKPVTCPSFWGGFICIPESFEFWQGRDARFHDRHRYSLISGKWKISRLAP